MFDALSFVVLHFSEQVEDTLQAAAVWLPENAPWRPPNPTRRRRRSNVIIDFFDIIFDMISIDIPHYPT